MRRIAECLHSELSIEHRDDRSILMLDRQPIQWRSEGTRGLAWSEGIVNKSAAVTSWQEAAKDLASCGLVIDGTKRSVHSSVAGVSPLYYIEDGPATYFASRIDPLVQTCDTRKLSIDWDAWAAIFVLTAPLGDRTPFLEVRRLPPYTRLVSRPDEGVRQRTEEWPWGLYEPEGGRGVASLAPATVEQLRHAVGAASQEPVMCPLSGGWDSRLLLSLLCEQPDTPVSAVTLTRNHSGKDEAGYAREVASELSVPHTPILPGRSFWSDAEEAALRADFQTTHHAWFMPLARRLRRERQTTLDGLAGGIFLKAHFIGEEMLTADSQTRISLLWSSISNDDATSAILSDRLGAALSARARDRFAKEATPFAEHAGSLSLAVYRTRTLRAISLATTSILGAGSMVLTPFIDDRVVRAALAVPIEEKLGGNLYRRLFDIVNPKVGSLPSSNDPGSRAGRTRRNTSTRALQTYRDYLDCSPIRAEINKEVWQRLNELPRRRQSGHLLRAITLLTMWHDRYRDKLTDVDVSELLS